MQIKIQLLSRPMLIAAFSLALVTAGCDKDNSGDTSVSTTDVSSNASKGANPEIQGFSPGVYGYASVLGVRFDRHTKKIYVSFQFNISERPPFDSYFNSDNAGLDVVVDPTPSEAQLKKSIAEAFIKKYPESNITTPNNVVVLGL